MNETQKAETLEALEDRELSRSTCLRPEFLTGALCRYLPIGGGPSLISSVSRTAVLALGSVLAFSATARAENTAGFYAGFSLAQARSVEMCKDGPYDRGCIDTVAAHTAFVGYRLHRFVGVEFGFAGMGPVSRSRNTSELLPGEILLEYIDSAEARLEHSVGLSVKAYAPFSEDFEPFARVGWHSYAVTGSREDFFPNGVSVTRPNHESGAALLLGAGARYRIGSRFWFRAEWERIQLRYDRWDDDVIHAAWVGISYRL